MKGYGWYLDQIRATTAAQLGYNDDPATPRPALEGGPHQHRLPLMTAAYASIPPPGREGVAGAELQPAPEPERAGVRPERLRRRGAIEPVVKKGDPLRVMEISPNCRPDIQQQPETAPHRPTRRSGAATAAPSRTDEGTVRLATRLLGRVPNPRRDREERDRQRPHEVVDGGQERRAKVGGGGGMIPTMTTTAGRRR